MSALSAKAKGEGYLLLAVWKMDALDDWNTLEIDQNIYLLDSNWVEHKLYLANNNKPCIHKIVAGLQFSESTAEIWIDDVILHGISLLDLDKGI